MLGCSIYLDVAGAENDVLKSLIGRRDLDCDGKERTMKMIFKERKGTPFLHTKNIICKDTGSKNEIDLTSFPGPALPSVPYVLTFREG